MLSSTHVSAVLPDRLEAVGERCEPRQRPRERRWRDGEGLHGRESRAQVQGVVLPGEGQIGDGEDGSAEVGDPSAGRIPAVPAAEAHRGNRGLQRRQRVIAGAQHRRAHAGKSEQAELLGSIGLLRPVPVEVLGEDVRHQRDLRADLEVGDLEARQLHDGGPIEVAVEQIEGGHADVARERGIATGGPQQMAGERRRGALALRAGHPDHALAAALRQPQCGRRRDRDARCGEREQLVPVRRYAG